MQRNAFAEMIPISKKRKVPISLSGVCICAVLLLSLGSYRQHKRDRQIDALFAACQTRFMGAPTEAVRDEVRRQDLTMSGSARTYRLTIDERKPLLAFPCSNWRVQAVLVLNPELTRVIQVRREESGICL